MRYNSVLDRELSDRKSVSGEIDNLISALGSGEKRLEARGLKKSSGQYLSAILQNRLSRQVLYITSEKQGRPGDKASNLSFFTGNPVPLLKEKRPDRKESLFPAHSYEYHQRMGFLNFSSGTPILCCTFSSLFERVVPKEILGSFSLHLTAGGECDREEFIDFLIRTGYREAEIVEKPADFSVRGAVTDIFPPGTDFPCRIEFIGDEIRSIRTFDISRQTSTGRIDRITVCPASEIITDDKYTSHAAEMIEKRALETGAGARLKNSMIKEAGSGSRLPGTEWMVPFYYGETQTLLSYLDKGAVLITDSTETPEDIRDTLHDNYKTCLSGKLLPSFEQLYTDPREIAETIGKYQLITLSDIQIDRKRKNIFTFRTEEIALDTKRNDPPLRSLAEKIRKLSGDSFTITLVTLNERDQNKLEQISADYDLPAVNYRIGPLDSGFSFTDTREAFITENDISRKERVKTRGSSQSVSSTFIKNFSELRKGDHIVHKEFGIGIFRGMERMRFGDTESDFIICEYAGGDRIYVPVEKLSLLQKYVGDGRKPRTDKLGSDSWKKTVRKAKKAAESVARELLELYAKRMTQKGFSFSPRDQMFREFELGFPYEETEDQARAIEEVLRDMEDDKPADRLICGDVGFGKTEVALRAAFKATLDGKQVAFIVPTTLLAQQHFDTSLKRLEGYPVNIEMISRFRTAKQEKVILEKLERGSVDIIIGTHKLLGNRVKFRNLGLVIIDEEHKFGVKHKEKLRALKAGVDVIALSATPIPRTLQFSLADIRDISLINSPPEGRQPVEVNVCSYDRETMREAMTDEITRGGSVFFIHNRIETIHKAAAEIAGIMPEAKIAVTHGRMQQRLLEKTINDFIKGEIDILVTTAIVESGLDIPRANTILVNDSHMFGIADLYQLKGRVGRGDRKAYAYFLIPSVNSLTPEARKRLEKISELSELGSGFSLSLSDLEIRGAGNLFGEEQSGHIADVGLEFYLDMLRKAVERLKRGDSAAETEPEIKTHAPAYIPNDTISDSAERLFYYKRISSAQYSVELRQIREEITDRYGEVTRPLDNLLDTVELKLILKKHGVEKADIGREQALLTFIRNSPLFHRFAPSGKFRVYYSKDQGYSIIKSRLEEMTDPDRSRRRKRK